MAMKNCISIDWEGNDDSQPLPVDYSVVDYDFFAAFDMKMLQGRPFSPRFPTDLKEACIINQTAAERIGVEDPIGLTIIMNHPEVKSAAMKVLISPEQGWDGYVMRVIELGKNGYTPKHVHAWPHINYVLEGKGVLHLDGTDTPVEAGAYAYVPADRLHQYKNAGDGLFRFICIVPREGHIV